jgi:hypothetical protein
MSRTAGEALASDDSPLTTHDSRTGHPLGLPQSLKYLYPLTIVLTMLCLDRMSSRNAM